MLDDAVVDEVLGARYMATAEQRYGIEGRGAVLRLLATVRRMYDWLDPLLLQRAVVVAPLVSGEVPTGAQPDRALSEFNALPTIVDREVSLQVTDGVSFNVWLKGLSPESFTIAHVTYVYDGPGEESVWIGDDVFELPRLERGRVSQLSAHTFFDLNEVLDDYEIRYARKSQCEILAEAWRTDKRLMFQPKPEDTMQKSLHNHIKHRLRGNITPRSRREIYQDIGERVDIEVTWPTTNRVAIIEIKWMGKSAPPGAPTPYTAMTEADAVAGAEQLARYLDVASSDAPDHQFMGTLAVFDGRRKSVNVASSSVPTSDGMHYANSGLTVDAKYLDRPDFHRVLRLFLEPVCE